MRNITEVVLDGPGRATVLHDGDLLEVMAVSGQYKDACASRECGKPWALYVEGRMRIHDLLPNSALITREYWLKRSQWGSRCSRIFQPAFRRPLRHSKSNLWNTDWRRTESNWRYSSREIR
jgi:hypothetical protein